MAGQHHQRLTPKQLALRDLESARVELSRQIDLVAKEWNPRAVMTRSFERYRVAWIGGAAVAGLAALKFLMPSPTRTHDPHDELGDAPRGWGRSNGALAMLLMPLLAMGRKAAMNYGMQFVQSWLQKRAAEPAHAPGTTE